MPFAYILAQGVSIWQQVTSQFPLSTCLYWDIHLAFIPTLTAVLRAQKPEGMCLSLVAVLPLNGLAARWHLVTFFRAPSGSWQKMGWLSSGDHGCCFVNRCLVCGELHFQSP